MKKRYLGILGLSCAALIMTGCGSSNKLVCTRDLSSQFDGHAKGEERLEVSFNSDGTAIEKVISYSEIEITDETMTNLTDAFKETLESECSDSDDFSSCDVKVNGNKIIMEAEMVMPEDEKNATIEETRKDIENSGYTCK